jgi:hypothetical protein
VVLPFRYCCIEVSEVTKKVYRLADLSLRKIERAKNLIIRARRSLLLDARSNAAKEAPGGQKSRTDFWTAILIQRNTCKIKIIEIYPKK